MRNIDETTITGAVIESMAACTDARLKTVMDSLVQHLHAFARDVQLTEAEWMQGIQFLSAVGHITDDKRQEFILLSDTLGLSMLVTTQNNVKPQGCTEATVFGPFFIEDAPEYDNGDDISAGAPGQACFVSGRVLDPQGMPVAGALLDVWQADETGHYDVQVPGASGHHEHRARGRLRADSEGRFRFRSILAESYPIPHDGPVGKMLEALGRHPWRPAHLHFMIQAPGFETLITHVFRDGDQYLDSDAVFGVRSTLIADWQHHAAGLDPWGRPIDRPHHSLTFDFTLNPSEAS